MYHGERYKQKRTKFEGKYEFSGEKLNGYEVWKPLYVEEEWTMTDENVVGPLWGSFEFLAKAAINVNNVDHNYMGEILIEEAIGYSRNTTALKTLEVVIGKVGVNTVINYLNNVM